MTDQCKHCTASGDWTACQNTACHQHENWGWLQLEQERDQLNETIVSLQARVMELEQLAVYVAGAMHVPMSVRDLARDELKRGEPQSLEQHEREVAARALEAWVSKNFHDAEHLNYAGAVVHRWAEKEAAKLRNKQGEYL